MKLLLLILVLITFKVQAQKLSGFDDIVSNAITIESSSQKLAKEITAGIDSDKDKLRAIYLWITDNIDYRVRNRFHSKLSARYRKPVTPHNISMHTLDEQVSEIVLRDRIAVCDGYARLFKTLCGHAGIKAEVITGYARGYATSSLNYFKSNHSWNAVYLDSTWQLLDVTWASGFINHRNEYVKHLDDRYYLTPPALFVLDHYPDDLNWALVKDMPTLKEFNSTPFKPRGYIITKIASYYPYHGIIEAKMGETVTVELKSNLTKLQLEEGNFVDQLRLSDKSMALTRPTIKGDRLTYSFRVHQSDLEWLHIFYNEEEVMRYRLKVIAD